MNNIYRININAKLLNGGLAFVAWLMCALVALVALPTLAAPASANEEIVDLSHVREAIHYFETPSNSNISHVAFTSAAAKLRHHFNSQVEIGEEWGQKSTYETTAELLEQTVSVGMLNRIKALLTQIAGNEEKQTQCINNVREFLPQDFILNLPLYIVWGDGENSSIAIIGAAFIDITNDDYKYRSGDIWNKCVLSLHKAQMQALHPIPFSINQIAHNYEMLAYIEQQALINGNSYYAAYSAHPAQVYEPDPMEIYNELSIKLAGSPRALNSDDWQLFNQLDTEALGNIIAIRIYQTYGKEALIDTYMGGAANFFKAFNSLN